MVEFATRVGTVPGTADQKNGELRMDRKRLAIEADTCRRLAKSYDGRPEQPFLLKAAALFDDLAEPRASERVDMHSNLEAACRPKI